MAEQFPIPQVETSPVTAEDVAEFEREPEEDAPDFVENPDGSVTFLNDPTGDINAALSEFGANLAEYLPEHVLSRIASELLDLVEIDRESRKKRDELYEEGLRRTGLGDDAPGGAGFDGASKVVHPVLVEACVDFEARAIKEIFPAKGPVKISIVGAENEQAREAAERKRDFLNWQMTRGIPEYKAELEQLLMQLPLGGSQYQKFWWDESEGRICTEFVPVDYVFLPFSATSFYTSPRITHMQFKTRYKFQEQIDSGFYRDLNVGDPAQMPEETAAERANDKIEGREADAYNEDGLRTVYEIALRRFEIEGDPLTNDEAAPYIIHVDEYSTKVLAIYRNWKEQDEKRKPRQWMVDWGLIPWRGAYSIGLTHLIGNLSGAATGALRALLDSAHIANFPGLVKLKSGRMSGQSINIDPTKVTEIDGPPNVNDIRNILMPVPFNGPSPVLFQLLGFLVDAAKGVVTTAEEKIADATNNMPVGTTLALIEQGSRVFSAIHSRLHDSQARAIDIICDLNAEYLDGQTQVEELGGLMVSRQDFIGARNVVPVSDPNIFSEAQRLAKLQAVQQMAQDQTVQWNRIELYHMMMREMDVSESDAKNLLPMPPKPQRADPVTENVSAMSGMPLQAFPDQDHLAHVETHLKFILDPAIGASPMVPGPALQPLLAHIQQHLVMDYQNRVMAGAQIAMQQGVVDSMTAPDKLAAVSATMAGTIGAQRLPAILELIQQANQLVASKMPPPQMDPAAAAAIEVAKINASAKAQTDQINASAKAQELAQKDAFQKFQAIMSERIKQAEMALDLRKNAEDNAQHHQTEIEKNREDNHTQILIEEMRRGLGDLQQVFSNFGGSENA